MGRRTEPDSGEFLTLLGRGTAPGLACGPLVLNRPSLGIPATAGAILVAARATPDDVARILASAGTLALSGAPLSHVSLLSREYRKPSVTLRPESGVRIPVEPGRGVLTVERPSGSAFTLERGDVVLVDGRRGTVRVPGGEDARVRSIVRRSHELLSAWGRDPEPARIARLLETVADHPAALSFVLEAGLRHGALPPGRAAHRLVEELRAAFTEPVETLIAELARRSAARVAEHGSALEARVGTIASPDELAEAAEDLAAATAPERSVLEMAGGGERGTPARLARVRRAIEAQRRKLAAALESDLAATLERSDGELAECIGPLERLARQARTAGVRSPALKTLEKRLGLARAAARERAGDLLVIPLDSGTIPDRDAVGGKAEGLFGVRAVLPAGCRVPRGFVVTTAAYRRHLIGEAGDRLRRVLGSNRDPGATSRLARAAVLGQQLCPDLAERIREALERLGSPLLAVRSSATVEDGKEASLAGQFDTYLGVTGTDALLDRIRRTWASLWNARALVAMRVAGAEPLDAAQAVIVQELVETTAAGVLLTRAPDDAEAVMVNAAWGLGEGISQGHLTGDLFLVRRASGELLGSEPASGRTAIVADPSGSGTLETPLGPGRSGRPCLQPSQLQRLAELARTLERWAGSVRDVEFGFDTEGALVLFQVRRIAVPAPQSAGDAGDDSLCSP